MSTAILKAVATLDSTKFQREAKQLRKQGIKLSKDMNLDKVSKSTGISKDKLKALRMESERFRAKMAGIKMAAAAAFGIGFVALIRGAIGAFAEMETIGQQFEVLFKDTAAAKKHLKDLKDFAAKTPFQLTGIAEASRLLFTFTDGALGGEESLKLVGDAAAGANRDISEVAMWVGRAYSAIKSGRPFGEAAQRLQEMGLLSGSVRNEMEQMSSATAQWDLLIGTLKNFDGTMLKLSETTAGVTSTMKDNWKIALAEMGEAFAPAVNGVLKGLTKIAQGFGKLIVGIQQVSAAAGNLSMGDDLATSWEKARIQVGKGLEDVTSDIEKAFTLEMDASKIKAKAKAASKPKTFEKTIGITGIEQIGGLLGGTGARGQIVIREEIQIQKEQLNELTAIKQKIDKVGMLK